MLAQRKAPVHQRRPATLYAEEDRLLRGQARSSRLAQHNVHALERDLIFARAEQEVRCPRWLESEGPFPVFIIHYDQKEP